MGCRANIFQRIPQASEVYGQKIKPPLALSAQFAG